MIGIEIELEGKNLFLLLFHDLQIFLSIKLFYFFIFFIFFNLIILQRKNIIYTNGANANQTIEYFDNKGTYPGKYLRYSRIWESFAKISEFVNL